MYNDGICIPLTATSTYKCLYDNNEDQSNIAISMVFDINDFNDVTNSTDEFIVVLPTLLAIETGYPESMFVVYEVTFVEDGNIEVIVLLDNDDIEEIPKMIESIQNTDIAAKSLVDLEITVTEDNNNYSNDKTKEMSIVLLLVIIISVIVVLLGTLLYKTKERSIFNRKNNRFAIPT
jgi:hypothetical protein